MKAYLIKRVLAGLIVIFGIVTIVFFLMRVVPGDPVAMLLGSIASKDTVAKLSKQMGLDQPLLNQYGMYLRQIFRGDFGESFYFGKDTLALFLEYLPRTLVLALSSFVFSVLVAIPLGVVAGLRPNSFFDWLLSTLSLLGQSFPDYWIGLMLILLLARNLNWFPSSGYGHMKHLVLPMLTLSVRLLAITFRMTRFGVLETLHLDFIRTAHAKGLAKRVVVVKHVLRNVAIPIVTVLGLQFGSLLGGAFIIEVVFAWPGVGRLAIDAIQFRDYPVVQTNVMMIAIVFVIINILCDIFYALLDPRIRY